MGFYCIAYQVSHKRSYQSTCSYIRDVSIRNTSRRFKMFLNHSRQLLFEECRSMLVILIYWFLYMGFSVLSTRCHTKSPTNLLVLIFGFQCFVFQVSRKRSFQSTGSYIWLLVYCLPGVTQKVLPIQRFLYMGFFFQEYIKNIWDVRQPQQPITIWRVQKYAGHLNLLVLIYGFQCIVYQLSHKRSYQSTGSYIWDFSFRNTSRRFGMYLNHNSQSLFGECRSMPGILIYWFLLMGFSVLSTRCHTKGPTNLQVLKYGFLLYCLLFVAQKVLPMYRFLFMGFFFQEYIKKIWDVPQQQQPITIWRLQKYVLIYWFLYMGFCVLSTRCHTKGPTNLQVLTHGIFLLGIHQEDFGCSSTTTGNHYLESAEICRAS